MTNGFRCSDVHKIENLNNLSINIFELIFYQDQNKWKHNLFLIENSKNESDKVMDLLIYKNHYALIKKLNVFLEDHNKNFIYKRCLNSYTSANMLLIQKPKCERYVITFIRTSSESYLHWKHHFHENLLYFTIYADFEVDNEIEDSKAVCNKTTNIYKQNPLLIGYNIVSELEDVLRGGLYKSS